MPVIDTHAHWYPREFIAHLNERPVEFVEKVPGLSAREREMIVGGNARRLLKL